MTVGRLNDEEVGPCPACGGTNISIEPDCPGYLDGAGKTYYCYPICGNVYSYVCLGDCYWVYIDGLHKTHFRYDINEMSRPDWL